MTALRAPKYGATSTFAHDNLTNKPRPDEIGSSVAGMASFDDVDQAILDKIAELLGEIPGPTGGARATANAALAINHLAEAHAWLTSPSQSHGGTSNASEGH